ncbi:hypothetical protein [Lysobacter capsici]|uniref:hypothetical protein n=1 Tax=Lysobacter capsici TaxID=435897 RepID=UPI000BBA5F90|nr:hypothetical protein [Lysobacter capsici]ATE72940.1 hypothetical protein CNO08_17220 [Lysobacter capsici]
MHIDFKSVEKFVRSVTREQSPAEVERTFSIFMCRCLATIRDLLPRLGRDALDLASSYWLEGKGEVAALDAANESCWNYLVSKGRGIDVLDKEDAAMRALICVLGHGDSVEDSVDSLEWFVNMFEWLGWRYSGRFNEQLRAV